MLVKCLVCGAVFDASIETCPVCGVGEQYFVPVDEDDKPKVKDTNNHYVILGGGIAALSAAKAIRERDRTGRILMISAEKEYPFNRPMLTKALNENLSEEELEVEHEDWYDENMVRIYLNKSAVYLDTNSQTVKAGPLEFLYDKIIIAVGAECFVPPFKGADQDHVVTIRHQSDVKKIREMVPNIKDAVVIGGGVLGLEAAWSLRESGLNVTVLETADRLLQRQLTADASEILAKSVADAGVKALTGVGTQEITKDSVILTDGTEVPAQLAVVSCGVRANTELAQTAGIEVQRAIVVDDRMRTNQPNVFAAGDCAQFEGINYALWSEAMEQGRVAGANAAGDVVRYNFDTPGLTFNGMNTSLFAIGDQGSADDDSYKIFTSNKPGKYERFTFKDGGLVGAILIGDTSRLVEMMTKVPAHAKFEEI